jgi:hypothetical protein
LRQIDISIASGNAADEAESGRRDVIETEAAALRGQFT